MQGEKRLKALLEPGCIGRLETRNRIVMAPMGTNLGEEDGRVSERMRRYYEERARGGAGLVIVGVAAITYPKGVAIPRQIGISDDRFLPGLTDLTSSVHRHGAKAAVQLQHAGKAATRDIAVGRPLLMPSLPSHSFGGMDDLTDDEMQRLVGNLQAEGAGLYFHELTVEEIAELVTSFADAADRAKRAGFDGVEIHAAHGYLIAAFLSRATNQRTDAYGGSVEKRARLLVEVIRAVRKKVGSDFPVWCRLDAREYRIEDGITLEESRETARFAEAAGVDALHVSAYGNPFSGIAFTEAPLVHTPGGFLPFAEEIKRNVRVPVIAVGRITPEQGDRAIRDGKADFIAMGRKLIADPELPNKLSAGQAKDIRPCVYCYTCVGKIFINESVVCAVNPAAGREAECEVEQAVEPKNVLVAGGGPAGMEAARVAALRGHRVTLCEREDHLGGTLFFSSLFWEPNGELVDYLGGQVRSLPIDLRLGQEVTPEIVAEIAPDVTLVAVGPEREVPAVPGAERQNVLSSKDLRGLLTGAGGREGKKKFSSWQRGLAKVGHSLGISSHPSVIREISKRWMPLGKRVAVVGGGLVGVELAQFLAERGRTVTVLEEGKWLAPQMAIPRRWRSLHELREQGVTLLTGVRVEAIRENGVVVVSEKEGERRTVECDHVILATGVVPNLNLAEELRRQARDIHLLGDCAEIRYIEGSMADGARIGREI